LRTQIFIQRFALEKVAEKQERLLIKCLELLPMPTASETIRQTSVTLFCVKFHENTTSISQYVKCGQKDGQAQRGYYARFANFPCQPTKRRD
jgi:hypothetical protein